MIHESIIMCKTVGFSKMILINLCSGQGSGYCLLISTNIIFYILVKNNITIEFNMDEKLFSANRTIKYWGLLFEEHL